MTKKYNLETIIAVIFFVLGMYSCKQNQQETYVIDLVQVFNGYQLKNDMEFADSIKLHQKIFEIDSLKAVLELQKSTIEPREFERYTTNLDFEFENELRKSNDRINEAVWKNVNKFIKDFGKEHDYKLILGANSTGNVMYFNQSIDVTTEFLTYLNKKYKSEKN